MNNSAIILVTKNVTAKDIPLIAKYNPFIISKEPITDMDVIRAFAKDGSLRGISGVDKIEDLSATIGNESVCIKGSVPINHIIAALSGEMGFTTTPDKETDVVDEPDLNIPEPVAATSEGVLLQRIEMLQVAINSLVAEMKQRPRQVIVKEDARSTRECNPGVIGNLEIGWLANIGG